MRWMLWLVTHDKSATWLSTRGSLSLRAASSAADRTGREVWRRMEGPVFMGTDRRDRRG